MEAVGKEGEKMRGWEGGKVSRWRRDEGNWSNYGKLGRNRHHCHLKKGHPTYVAVWEVKGYEIKLVEVTYVGSHEKAPY